MNKPGREFDKYIAELAGWETYPGAPNPYVNGPEFSVSVDAALMLPIGEHWYWSLTQFKHIVTAALRHYNPPEEQRGYEGSDPDNLAMAMCRAWELMKKMESDKK
jgi:hypothetical protein